MKEMKTSISILLKESSFRKLEEMRGNMPRGKYIEMLIDEKTIQKELEEKHYTII